MKRKDLFYLIVLVFLSATQTLKAQLETCNLVITDGIQNETLKKSMEKNVSDFLTACNVAVIKGDQPNLNKQTVTDDARKGFSDIWKTSPIGCSVDTLKRNCLTRSDGGYQIRDIPVTMLDAPENERNQEIVLNLTADGKIDDVIIPITQYTDLLYQNIDEEDINLRMVVLDFVEHFRTAYNRKDLKYLGTLFSDNAIIIVGKEIKETQKPMFDVAQNSLPVSKGKMFQYQLKTKKEYLASLVNTFKNNKYIDVRFDSIEVVRDPDPNNPVYGVTLKQDWKSSTYMDTGYVFLLIDFTDKDNPLITVRTWQPAKYNGQDLRPDERFQLRDFY